MMIIDIVTEDVEKDLNALIMLMSPAGATAFLGTQVGPYLRRRAGERFEHEGDDVVGKWAPLRPATVVMREASNYPVAGDHPINHLSGELENWVVDGGWNAYPDTFGASMTYPGTRPSGLLAKKVKTAQSGDRASNTVARPVLGVNEADMLWMLTAYKFAVEAVVQ